MERVTYLIFEKHLKTKQETSTKHSKTIFTEKNLKATDMKRKL